jgi:lysophospholipase L1-like esterase
MAVLLSTLPTVSHAAAASPPPALLANQRVLWLGDSITQDGKYVSFVQYFLDKQFPDQKFDFISIGLASETVSGLSEKDHPFPRPCVFERLGRALEKIKPATVIACYGMNDGIYHPQNAERMKAFRDGIGKLSAAVKAANAKLILLTPPPFDPQPVASRCLDEGAPDFSFKAPYVNYDRVLSDYAHWEIGLAGGEAELVVDLHTVLGDYLRQRRRTEPGFSFSTDGIHPSPVGHLLMAETFLVTVGVPVDEGNLEQSLARIQADPLYKLVNEQREKRSNGWLAYVGYTRDKTVKTDSIEQTENEVIALQEKIDALRKAGP